MCVCVCVCVLVLVCMCVHMSILSCATIAQGKNDMTMADQKKINDFANANALFQDVKEEIKTKEVTFERFRSQNSVLLFDFFPKGNIACFQHDKRHI